MKWNLVIAVFLVLFILSLGSITRLHHHISEAPAVTGRRGHRGETLLGSSRTAERPQNLLTAAPTSSDDNNDESTTTQPPREEMSSHNENQLSPKNTKVKKSGHKRHRCSYAGGRDIEASHVGCSLNPDTCCCHAWGVYEEDSSMRCHGAAEIPDCTSRTAYEFAAKHILFVIVTGGMATFRIEVSQCTWLRRLPPDNVFIVTDFLPKPKPRTPHRWIEADLPDGMRHRGHTGDFESDYMKKGYLHAVRKAGQGYSAGWILAQTRFTYGLKHAARVAVKERPDIKWVMLMDDDTIVQLDHLVDRVRHINESAFPWYFSRRGWGGAGHLYSRRALQVLHERLHECEHKYFVRQFRASDAMLLKCAGMLKLRDQMEHTMSHCPAATRPENVENPRQVTVHGKKDFYPPVLLATWRVSLYYLAMYCKSPKAVRDVVKWSACTYGASCKRATCDQVVDRRRKELWQAFSKNESLKQLPFSDYLHDIHVPTR